MSPSRHQPRTPPPGKKAFPPRNPVPDHDPRYEHPSRCGHYPNKRGDWHRRTDGSRCLGWVIKGTTTCPAHASVTPSTAKANGRVVVEVARWGLDGDTELRDPGEVLLRLVTQSAARVDLYGRLLGQAYDAAERLAAAQHAGEVDETAAAGEHPDAATAAQDLRRIFSTGGVAALVGHQWSATKDGDIYATGEAIRGLAQLEASERDRCAGFAAKAVAAGLAERQVRVAEQVGATLVAMVLAAVDVAGVAGDQRATLLGELMRQIEAVSAGPAPKVLEGVAR